MSYITVEEAEKILEFELKEYSDYSIFSTEKKQYFLDKATNKINSLDIKYRGKGENAFPLIYQKEIPDEIMVACALESAYMALGKESEALFPYRNGIISESETGASVTYNSGNNMEELAKYGFNNLETIKILERYIRKSVRIS